MARVSPSRLPRRWSALVLGAWMIAASSLPGRAETDQEVLQMMADAAVIDATCRTTNTMYGAVFRFGAAHGIAENDVLLSGRRRADFEAAMTLRLSATPTEELCGALLTRYREAFPDWFRSR